jgi:hypothetical protein
MLDSVARVKARKNSGSDVGTRRRLNFVEGEGVTITVEDVSGDEEVKVTIASTAVGGTGGRGSYKYICYVNGGVYYCYDVVGTLRQSGSDGRAVLQWALDNLTAGRLGREIVKVQGEWALNKSSDTPPSGNNSYCIKQPIKSILDLNEATLTLANSQNADVICMFGAAGSSPSDHAEIWGGRIEGNKANQTAGHGILVWLGSAGQIVGTLIQNAKQDGLRYYGTSFGDWCGLHDAWSVRVYSSGRYGVYMNYHNDDSLWRVVAQSSVNHNFYLFGNVKLTTCHSIYSGGYSYYLAGDRQVLIDCDADTPSGSHNVYITGNGDRLVGCYILGTPSGYNNIRLGSASNHNMIADCKMSGGDYAVYEVAGGDYNIVHDCICENQSQGSPFAATGAHSNFHDNIP